MNFTESMVEDAALAWFGELGYAQLHGQDIAPGERDAERTNFSEAFLPERLRAALKKLNPQVPAAVLDDAYRKITIATGPNLIAQNRAFHRMLVDGIAVECRRKDSSLGAEIVRLIDFDDPENNDWLVVNQFTVIDLPAPGTPAGGQHNRRPDVVIFINGLPLGVIELKNAADENADVWQAFAQLQTYKQQIPALFHHNAVLVISDGLEARIGTISADRERFMPWRTIDGENIAPATMPQLEVLLRGVFEKRRFLALIRHFIVFEDDGGKAVIKKLAGYHQFHAVNIAVAETLRAAGPGAMELKEGSAGYFARKQPGGEAGDQRVGVVWHTQGSGKSLTMAFYAGRLVVEPGMENPTLVILTDRNDLDDQLFGTFARCHELLRQKPIQAASRRHLRTLLARASGGVIFTTIQKFMPPEPSSSTLLPAGEGSEGQAHYRGGFEFSGLVETARKLRKKQTSAEDLLWALLRNRQLCDAKFRRQHQFGGYICDFYCHAGKLVVECDGQPHTQEWRRKKDAKRNAYLRALGLTVLRFENRKVLQETASVLAAIAAKLTPISGLPSPLGRRAGDEGGALSARRNIVVIADEAHRSQYDFVDGFARHLRDALPNASFIGFTGTPIEKADANTRAVFGDYISIYDIQCAVEDQATVPIFYESRLAKLELKASERPKIDPDFEEATEGEEAEHKEKLKTKWAALEAIVGSDKRIGLIAEDLVKHWEARLEVMNGKAMIVCMSRRICFELYEAIRKLRPQWHHPDDTQGVMKIVMTGSASDPLEWQDHIRNQPRREALAKRFKNSQDPFQIVIVRDMWLTGFDAPCLHTMYLDKPMRSHGLMQAIARVNRVFKDKPGGLVVDYLGLAHELKQALATYTESGGHGQTAIDQEEAVAVMREKYEICRDHFHLFDWSKWASGQPAEKLGLLPAAQEFIYAKAAKTKNPDEHKQKFLRAVTALSQAFALAVPHVKAMAIRDDVGFFQAVRAAIAKNVVSGKEKSPGEIDAAIRQIISRAVASDEVVDIFAAAGLKKPDISILSDDFLAEVRGMPQKNLAIELLRKLLSNEIKIRAKKFLIQSKSFADLLENSIRKYQNRAIEAAQVIEELIQLAKEMRQADRRGKNLGLSQDEVAFYDALETNDSAVKALGDENLKFIAQELVKTIRANVTIDWTVKESVRAKLRVMVKKVLNKFGYPPDKQEKATQTVLQQAELLCADWAGP